MLAEGFINKSCRRYSICAVRRSDKAVAFPCSMLHFPKGVVVVLWDSYSINAYMCCWHQHQQSSKLERMTFLQVVVEKKTVHRMHMLAYHCWPAPVIVTTACVHCPAKMPTLLELASSMKCSVFTSVCHLNNRIAGVRSCLTSCSPCTAGRTTLHRKDHGCDESISLKSYHQITFFGFLFIDFHAWLKEIGALFLSSLEVVWWALTRKYHKMRFGRGRIGLCLTIYS